MDLRSMIEQLKSERAGIEEAIAVLARLEVGSGAKRRGRPPKYLMELRMASANHPFGPLASKARVKRAEKALRKAARSAATRRKMAEAQRARRKKEQKVG